jgi:hypothetical protein
VIWTLPDPKFSPN